MKNALSLSRAPRVILLAVCAAVLLVAIAWSVSPPIGRPVFQPTRSLRQMLPTQVAGWTYRDLPLGNTELLLRETEQKLQFDDACYRVYRQGDCEVGVYVAYWSPGKMDPWLISLHTPDVCWVGAGARLLRKADDFEIAPGGARPGSFRAFDWPGATPQEVVYWHLYGGKLSGFPLHDEGKLRARFDEFVHAMRNTGWGRVKREQVFVRISTNRSIAEVAKSDLWPVLLAALAPTGLRPGDR